MDNSKLTLRDTVKESLNCRTCNVTGGILLKPGSSVLLDLTKYENLHFTLQFRKLSGNGKIQIQIDNFSKEFVISNNANIPTHSGLIKIFRSKNSIGDVSLFNIIAGKNITKLQHRAKDSDNEIKKRTMAVVNNPKLYGNLELQLEDEINVIEALNSVDKVIIHCPGKTGEIIAATSVAKYIKKNYPSIHVRWVCAERYKKVVQLSPYIDSVDIFDKKISNNADIGVMKNSSIKYVQQFKNKGYAWLDGGILNLNVYYNYMYTSSYVLNQKPFNEQFFDCLGINYNIEYNPDLKYSDEDLVWVDNFASKNGDFCIIFPFGHDISPLTFDTLDYVKLKKELAKKNIKMFVSGSSQDVFTKNIANEHMLFGLDICKTLALLAVAKFVIGVNSGVVFSAMFQGCNNIVMDDGRTIRMWNPNNLKIPSSPNILCKNKLSINDVCYFVSKHG